MDNVAEKNFSKFGAQFQVTTLSLFFRDKGFANKIKHIIRKEYFDNKYLQWLCEKGLEYLTKYSSFPYGDKIFENLEILINKEINVGVVKLYLMALENVKNAEVSDRQFVIEQVENFCFIKHALLKLEEQKNNIILGNFEEAKKIAHETFRPLNAESEEINLTESLDSVMEEHSAHKPVPTVFETFNRNSKGGPGSGDLAIVVAQSSLGKCFAKGTKIRMFDNTVKCVEDIIEGDKVMGWDGTPRLVTSLARGEEQMYEVEQQYGDNYEVNESHILCLKPTPGYLKNYPKMTSEKVNITVKDYLKQSKTWQKYHKGYASGIEYQDVPLTIDPYFLGLWLGDGNKSSTQICGIDERIGEYVKLYSERLKMNFSNREDKNKVQYWNIINSQGKENYLKEQLKKHSLLFDKHIPTEFLYNSRESRLLLLAGLIDSDGYLEAKGKLNYEIAQKNEQLAREVFLLARGLGFKASLRRCVIKVKKKDYVFYKIRLSYKTNEIPTLLERKQASKDKRGRVNNLSNIKLIKKEVGEYFGFTLSEDKDRMFLLEDYTVVHNTAFLTAQARNAAVLGYKVLYFSLETKNLQLVSRALAGLSGINQECLKDHPLLLAERIKEIKGEVKFIRYKSTQARVGIITSKVEELKAEGFFPDMIVIDGLNQLKGSVGMRFIDNNEKFEYLAEELRDMGTDLQCPIWAAFQANRGGFNVEYADEQNIGKAIEVYQVADYMVMLTQSVPMAERQEVYAQLLKNRLGGKGIMVRAAYDPNQGTFVEIEQVLRSMVISSGERSTIKKGLETIQKRIDEHKRM